MPAASIKVSLDPEDMERFDRETVEWSELVDQGMVTTSEAESVLKDALDEVRIRINDGEPKRIGDVRMKP
jgi:hypothetical protein